MRLPYGLIAVVTLLTITVGQEKNPRTPEKPINSSNVHERWMYTTYIELLVDGDIIDLNRINLSTAVVDERFKQTAN